MHENGKENVLRFGTNPHTRQTPLKKETLKRPFSSLEGSITKLPTIEISCFKHLEGNPLKTIDLQQSQETSKLTGLFALSLIELLGFLCPISKTPAQSLFNMCYPKMQPMPIKGLFVHCKSLLKVSVNAKKG